MMSPKQAELLPESVKNFIISSQMEGITVSDDLLEMCLSVVRGDTTLAECLAQIKEG